MALCSVACLWHLPGLHLPGPPDPLKCSSQFLSDGTLLRPGQELCTPPSGGAHINNSHSNQDMQHTMKYLMKCSVSWTYFDDEISGGVSGHSGELIG